LRQSHKQVTSRDFDQGLVPVGAALA